MERNADVIRMECFAPLFVNVSQLTGNGRSMQWSSDLIGYVVWCFPPNSLPICGSDAGVNSFARNMAICRG